MIEFVSYVLEYLNTVDFWGLVGIFILTTVITAILFAWVNEGVNIISGPFFLIGAVVWITEAWYLLKRFALWLYESIYPPLSNFIGTDMLLFGIPLLLIMFLALLVIDCVLFYNEVEKWSGIVFAVALGVLIWFGLSSDYIITSVEEHGGWIASILKLAGLWVVAGAVTATLKWLQLSNRMKRYIKETRESFQGTASKFFLEHLPQDSSWRSVSKRAVMFEEVEGSFKLKLKTAPFRSLMMDWMTYWPVELMVLLFADLFRMVYDFIIDAFSGFFEKISEAIMGKALK